MTERTAIRQGTPLMRQYQQIKSQHRDAILFFRMGDFYEMFFEDAQLGARLLNITLTSRGDGVPLAGVPVKAAGEYVRRLLAQGHRVAICEQVEDPKTAKGLVRREVVETITPGSILDDGWLPGDRNNFLVALVGDGTHIGIAAADLSTGEFSMELVAQGDLEEALGRLAPSEVVTPRGAALPRGNGTLRTERDDWEFESTVARRDLAERFGLASVDGLGLGSGDDLMVGAAGALLRYLGELQPGGLPHLARPTIRRSESHLWLDDMTRRNLELVEPLRAGPGAVTLRDTIDRTMTPMGARLLRQWLLSPLRNPVVIRERLDAVEVLVQDNHGRARLRETLDGVRDLERLASRAAAGRATPRELGALRDSLLQLPALLAALAALTDRARSEALSRIAEGFDVLADLAEALSTALNERLPATLAEGGVFRSGYDPELDEARSLCDGGKQYIVELQAREREQTGIATLKVGFNKVFGYYLETTKSHAARVPAHYERRQTLTNAERFVTSELKEHEAKVLGAEQRVETRECELFLQLRQRAGAAIERLQCAARALAQIDVWAGLADVAIHQRYVRPVITPEFAMSLTGSRHPVLEGLMAREEFIPNDVSFDRAERVLLVTGPNMSGKSTILRQIGLIVVLAQMGAFVPASAATIGVVDRLFTRVGASDNLARGQSTFMVEMSESSAILHNATADSLVLLDEIGRGTSTYDGVAIAWAVTEYLHDVVGCKTMFATHYHELMQLPERLQHARNWNVAVRETENTVVFLHRLEPGGTDRSYGIHVAELAGLPSTVVQRANEILHTLEHEHRVAPGAPPLPPDPGQLPLFGEPGSHPAVKALQDLDVDSLTPLEALNRLADLKRRAGE